jgi:hypothetical protein
MAWYDDLNNGFPLGGQQQPGSIEALRATMAARQPAPVKKKKDFWTDQLSTGTGLGGALGGAALGAGIGSIVPGIGTVIGGLAGGVLGGALGSGGGELAENAITGDPLLQNVGQEAFLGGVFSAPPIRLAKGVIGAGKALSTGAKGIGEQTVKQGFEQGFSAPGTLSKLGSTLRGEGRGVGIGEKVAGSRIGPERTAEINNFLEKTVKIKGLTAAKQLESLESFIKKRADSLSGSIAKSDRALTAAEKRSISKALNDEFSSAVVSPTSRQQQILSDIATRIGQTKKVSELDALRKTIDESINFARNSASPDTAAEQVYKLGRRLLTDNVASRVGAAKGLKSDLSKAFEAQDLLLNRAAGGGGLARTNGTSVLSIPVPARATQAVETGLGRGLGVLGSPTAATAGRFAVGGMINGGAKQASLEDTLMQQAPENQYLGSPGFGEVMQSNPDGSFNPAQPGAVNDTFMSNDPSALNAPNRSPYSQEQLLFDMQRDPQNADKYLEFYSNVQKVFPSGGAGADLTVSQMTRAAAAQNALQDIPLIEESIRNGKLGGAKAIPGASTQIGRAILGTENLDAALFNIADNILRARSGAAAPEAEVQRFVDTFLPGPLDSEEAKVQKLQRAVRELQGYVNPQQASQPGLEDALLQIQGSY